MSLDSYISGLSPETIGERALPLREVLQDSFFYPSSGFDTDAPKSIDFQAGSYIYVDYGISRKELLDSLDAWERLRPFGSLVAHRPIQIEELIPQGWAANWTSDDGDPSKFQSYIASPFCEWIIFRTSNERLISLLFLCADGVASYQALYNSNNQRPKYVALVQPGHIHGNWTNYLLIDRIFHRSVKSNSAGMPECLLVGGYYQLPGDKFLHQQPIWPEYGDYQGFSRRRIIADRGRLYRGRVTAWWRKQSEAPVELSTYTSSFVRQVLKNGRVFLKVRFWHNFWSLIIQPQSPDQRTPNPIMFENCAAAKFIDEAIIFRWHLWWIERAGLQAVAIQYLDKLNEECWEH